MSNNNKLTAVFAEAIIVAIAHLGDYSVTIYGVTPMTPEGVFEFTNTNEEWPFRSLMVGDTVTVADGLYQYRLIGHELLDPFTVI